MKTPSLRYELLADDKTAKGLNSAKKNIGGFEKGVESLGKKIAAAFAVEKIIAFGKASVEAFAADQKSAALLANTLKNLSIGFADANAEQFIQKMTMASGVADDVLRPALGKLITQTGDYFKSQELLNQALDISRGSGVDLATVTQDLANAYVGNTKGLKKYNLGLTQAELKTASFADITKKLNDQFKGANVAYLKTYAGQMEVLKNSAAEAQETIGKGLVDSLNLLAGNTSVADLGQQMQDLATYTSDVIYGISSMIAKLKNIPVIGKSLNVGNLIKASSPQLANLLNALDFIKKYGEKEQNKKLQNPSVQMFMTDQNNQRLARLQVKTSTAQTKATKALTAEQKKQALLKKQGTLFDMEQIQLIAALKGKLSDEERNRVLLQLALLQGNEEAAAKLSTQIANSIDKTGNLAKYLQTLPDANNPFKNWDTYLKGIEDRVKAITNNPPGSNNPAPNAPVNPYGPNNIPRYEPGGTGLNPPSTAPLEGTYSYSPSYGLGGSRTDSAAGMGTIVVQIDGKTIASTLMDQSLNGNQTYINRRTGGFDF